MFAKAEQDLSGMFVMESEISLGVDAQIVHVDFQPSFSNHIGEDVIHKRLESG